MTKTFPHGVHPVEYKELTRDLAIIDMPIPERLEISLSQHFGAPSIPIVTRGQDVQEGDLIAKADGFISAPIHSPISGKIKQITKTQHVSGIFIDSIIIERDKTIKPKSWKRNSIQAKDLDLEAFTNLIKEKGIVGLGGAGFPTFVKFLPKQDSKLEKILINACECEPYINVDNRAILEQTDLFLQGIKLIKKVTGVDEVIIGIEDNKKGAINLLEDRIKDYMGITVLPLKTKYPQGGEKMLIKAVLNKEVPRGGLPLDVGVIVLNANTVIAITEAVYYDKPILEKLVTVSGLGIKKPQNIRVKIGTSFSKIIEFCGGLKEETQRLIVGGPMMGFAQPNINSSVLKSTTGLLALTSKEIGSSQEIQACIRCGDCVKACPMGLIPSDLARYISHGKLDLAIKAGLLDCIECGSCAFVCPAAQPIVQFIKIGKLKHRQKGKK